MTDIQKQLAEALKGLLIRDMARTCQHMYTHRAGFIWEICDDCGRKWADDEGGKPEWKDPAAWELAEKALAAHHQQEARGPLTDSDRLDWLEEQTKKSPTGISFDYCRHVEDGYVQEKGFRFMRRAFLGERAPTLRDAIDRVKGE